MTTLPTQKLFTELERTELTDRIRTEGLKRGYQALICFDPANIAYATGLVFPFPEQFAEPQIALILPVNPIHAPVLVCPPEWRQLAGQQGWTGAQIIYTATQAQYPGNLIAALVKGLRSAVLKDVALGYEHNTIPYTILQVLREALPGDTLLPADDLWRLARLVKSPGEVRMLEEAARQADRALVSALNHSEGCAQDTLSYSLWEFTERIRVHVGEFSGSATGHVATMQGEDLLVYSHPPRGNMNPGHPMRTEFTSHHLGFWASNTRTVHVGLASEAFAKAYSENILLKRATVALVKPGAVCAEIFKATAALAGEKHIPLCEEYSLGYGVGRSEREAPYLCPGDDTLLQPGMVLTVGIYTRGPRGELICSRDTYLVTETGSRLLSWYRDWDSKLYRLVGITARHG